MLFGIILSRFFIENFKQLANVLELVYDQLTTKTGW